MNPRFLAARGVALLAVCLVFAAALAADEPYARSRDYDLQNARIHLWINPEQSKITGEVTHTLAPLRDSLTQLEFDSVGLKILSVSIGGRTTRFETTDSTLRVPLEAPRKAGERLDVTIRYEGQPKRRGMFFILPDRNYPQRPAHVWTQGEAEETRYYIPIYDYPNDLTASEMIATVPKGWITLSNGKLLSVKDEADGTKTWHWRQSQPHAVYLISLVAGEFEEVQETWRNIPVTYYVPRGDRARIAPTFGRTKKMLDLFSEKFGPYPWDKYAQIAVEEHFGGMEHTSATTLTNTSTFPPEMAPEYVMGADGLISHELAHQWWGDLVTCKDWASLWINEGFASFAAFLWDEHHYGADEAVYSIWQSRNNWLSSKRLFAVPIVTRDFTDSTQYSGNVYGKASLVIAMLRRELGDADFFRAMRHFLQKYRHQNVVSADLIQAIEESTGRNTDAFFEQWIYGAGAPQFDVRYTYDAPARQVKLEVKQAQKVEGRVGLFRVPVEVEITTPAGSKSHTITVSQASETFAFPAEQQPLLVLFDKGGAILKLLDFKKDPQEWIYQLRNAEAVPDRADAARALAEIKGNEEAVVALGEAARKDRFWGVRVQALGALGAIGGLSAQREIEAALINTQPWVRMVAVELMGGFQNDATIAGKIERIFREDKAYRVRGAALDALARQKPANALEILTAATRMDSPEERLRTAALRGLGVLGDDKAVPLLAEWAAPGKPFNLRSAAIGSFGQLDKKNKGLTLKLTAYAAEPYNAVRFAALSALSQRGDAEAIAPLEAMLARGELEGFAADFARNIVRALKMAQGQQPGAGAAPAGGVPAKVPAEIAQLAQQILEKLEKLERETAEIKERLRKLEEKLGPPK